MPDTRGTAGVQGGRHQIPLPQVRSVSWEKPTVARLEGLSANPSDRFVRARGSFDRKAIAPVFEAILDCLGHEKAPASDGEGSGGWWVPLRRASAPLPRFGRIRAARTAGFLRRVNAPQR